MKLAKKVKDLVGWRGDARLYELSEPVTWTRWERDEEVKSETLFVIVSAAVPPFSEPETYIFPAYESGEIANWGELTGSFKGGLDHVQALAGAGYEVMP